MRDKISIEYFKTPIGELMIGSFKNQICLCDWRYRKMRDTIDLRIKNHFQADFLEEQTPIAKELINQINLYFNKSINTFDIPIHFAGTDFQKKVWNELLKIPYGKTISYLDLSKKLNNEKAIRAVASANGANALSIVVPCHRIIGNKGELIGYAGGLTAKKKLLELENPLLFNTKDLFTQQ